MAVIVLVIAVAAAIWVWRNKKEEVVAAVKAAKAFVGL